MAEYKIKDILDPTLVSSDSSIADFINDCKKTQVVNITETIGKNGKPKKPKKSALYKKLEEHREEILCYQIKHKGVSYITIPRKTLELITNNNIKTLFTNASVKSLLKKLSGKDDQLNFFELINSSDNNTTQEKQDFTCYAVWYFFNNSNHSLYDFYEHLKQESNLLQNNKSKLFVSSSSSELKEFSLLGNYSYVLDSVTVAKTLIKNSSKLNMKGSLSSYCIAEEDSTEGIRYKSLPFKKIALTEKSYYNAPDKLTTADMFIFNPQAEGMKKLSIVLNQSMLTHLQYQTFMDEAYKRGDIIPISLKQLKVPTISDNLTTNLIKVIGSLEAVDKDLKDPFFSTVLHLLSISNRNKFVEEMNNVIEIDNKSFDYKLAKVGRTKFNFNIKFVNYDNSSKYEAFLQSGQIYIKPEGTGSASGIGGIARDYVNDQIVRNLPEKNVFFRSLKKIREDAFEKPLIINGTQVDLKIKDISIDYTNILPGLKFTNPQLTIKDEALEFFVRYAMSLIDGKPFYLTTKEKKFVSITKKMKMLDQNKLVDEAVKLGISDKRTIQSRLNIKNQNQLIKYQENLVKQIKSKAKLKKQKELINAAVQLKLVDKIDAVKMEVDELADLISNSKAYRGLTNYPALMKSDLLSPGVLSKVFASIPEGVRKVVAKRYIEGITKHMKGKSNEILNDFEREFESKKNFLKDISKPSDNKVTFDDDTKAFFEKLASYEMLYLCSSNEDVVKKWIKNSFIMSTYALAAAYGIIIFNGKRYNLSSFGKIARKNPIYVKIGE
jgi:hypothetical protein